MIEEARLFGAELVRPGDVLCDRYCIASPLGQGAHAEVWRARDRATNQDVALKLLQRGADEDRTRVRREVAALRLLRMPGVVRILDEGTHRGQTFVVMELVQGRHFPGSTGRLLWTELAPRALSLLDALHRVHALGVIHCDLKPSNVLVGPLGQAVLLDFGIADVPRNRWTELAPEGGWVGTAAYLAPEVLLGDPPSRASDLYAVGMMLYESLAGVRAHPEASPRTALRERLAGPIPLASRVPGISPELEAVVHALLAPEPEARPRSAREAMDALASLHGAGADAPTSWVARDAPVTEASLRALFAGRDRLLHTREDAAALLMKSAGGDASAIDVILAEWKRAGLVRWEGRAFVLEADVETLRFALGEEPDETRTLAATLMDPAASVESLIGRSMTAARRAVDEGLHADAKSMLAQAAREARLRSVTRPVEPAALEELFSAWIEVAVLDLSPTDVDALLYELAHARGRSARLASLAELAQAALDLHQDPPRAAARLAALPPFASEMLERLRAALRMIAARSGPVEEERALLDEIIAWGAGCAEELSSARVLGFRGRYEYRMNEFELSAVLHEASARKLSRPFERAAAHLNAASARVEACQFDDALDQCDAAAKAMGARRNPLLALRVEWLRRLARYRRGEPVEPDVELIEAAEAAALPGYCAPLLLLEAAVHLRRESRVCGAALARRAADTWRALHALPDFVTLCACLELACVGAVDDELAARLCAATQQITTFGLELQALGLLALGGWRATDEARARASRRMDDIVPEKREVRLDVLSATESLALILERREERALIQ